MNFHSSTELARLLSSNTMLLTALNLMFASTLLLLLCFSLKAGSRSWTNSRTQHLISVHAVLALGILPLFMLLPEARSGSFVLPAMISLEVYASNSAALAPPRTGSIGQLRCMWFRACCFSAALLSACMF